MKLVSVFVATFFFSVHYAATLYVNSTFLSEFFSTSTISILYVLGAAGNIFFFLKAPRILARLGSRKFLLAFLLASAASIFALPFSQNPVVVGIWFVIYASVAMMVYYALDLFLEEVTAEKKTGAVRGMYLTIANLAILGGPVLVAMFADFGLRSLYVVAAGLTLPIFILSAFTLKLRAENERKSPSHLPFITWWRSASVRRASLARFLLEAFYGVMTIFVPIYLHEIIGFSWTQIGSAFFFMLLPFVLFQVPAGILADKKLGEREMLTFGFAIGAAALLFMPALGQNIFHWTILLFISRVGASLIEIMTETYFFKHVDERNAGTISIFRLMRPAGLIAGAGLGAVAISIWQYQSIFYLLAFSFLVGWNLSRKLVDTK